MVFDSGMCFGVDLFCFYTGEIAGNLETSFPMSLRVTGKSPAVVHFPLVSPPPRPRQRGYGDNMIMGMTICLKGLKTI